ncbi:MAG: hypothetical protein KKD74_08155 [Bacteroidetes bacterium]|nr:hypothetical protein [Bacteroidota bacterium]
MGIKKQEIWLAILLFINGLTVFAQDNQSAAPRVKKGWNFGILPAVSFNSDLGFQYGGLINLFHYGDGSRYPKYNHSYYLEASRYTKGSALLRFAYDSDILLKGIRTTFDISYMPEQAIDFYGFNGYDAVYEEPFVNQDDPSYLTRIYYKHRRDMLRIHTDFTGSLGRKNLYWAAGLEYYDLYVSSVDVDRLNKGKSEADKLPDPASVPGLYENYVNWGLIEAGEAKGGSFLGIKAGLVYDSRDFQPNPMRGTWTDAILYVAPAATSSFSKGFMHLSITHRQYFTLVQHKLSFVYRLSYQGNLGTYVPFYVQPLMVTTQLKGAYSEGLGGQRSLRGVLRNRVVGDGFVYGNAEFRYKFYRTAWLNQQFYFALNAFVDAGQLVKKIPIEEKLEAIKQAFPEHNEAFWNDHFNPGAESIHWTTGLGLKLVMNENFILSGDYGRALNRQDGKSGIYIGLNYLF